MGAKYEWEWAKEPEITDVQRYIHTYVHIKQPFEENYKTNEMKYET